MPAGQNYLGSLVKEVCKEAGIEGEKSNHIARGYWCSPHVGSQCSREVDPAEDRAP